MAYTKVMVKYIDKFCAAAGIPTMVKKLACNSITASSAVAFAEELANRAEASTAKRLTTLDIDAKSIQLLQDAVDAQTLQGTPAPSK